MEYWIVDPIYQTVEVYSMNDDRYRLFSFAEEKGKITSSILPGFEMEVRNLFE